MCVFFQLKPQKTGVSEQKVLYSGTLLSSFFTSLSVFLDLNAPCRHDFTTLCQQRRERHVCWKQRASVHEEGERVKSFYGPMCCIIVTFDPLCIGKEKKRNSSGSCRQRVCGCTSELKPQEALIRREIQCYLNKMLIVAKLRRLKFRGVSFNLLTRALSSMLAISTVL